MKPIRWSEEKNIIIKRAREIGFEHVEMALEQGRLLDIIDHPNKKKYTHQYLMIININKYAYVVPFVDEKDTYFLKTVFPSRKYTKLYLEKL